MTYKPKQIACIMCGGTGFVTEVVQHQSIDFVCDACSGSGAITIRGVINDNDKPKENDNEYTDPTSKNLP